MAILISAGWGLILGQLGAMMLDLSGRDIPRLAVSLQLASESQNLASQGPALLASGSADALKDRSRKMKETQQVALRKLGEITELGADKAVVSAMGETLKSIDDTITSLGTAAQERLDLATQHDRLYEALRKAQDAFVAVAAPAMMDAQARMNAVLASANPSQADATETGLTIEQLGDVIASSNLIASDLMAALSANNSDAIEPIEKTFKDAQQRIKSQLDSLSANGGSAALKAAALNLLALGEGKAGVFKVRQKELDANDYGQLILDENRKLNVGLGISVQQLVDNVR